MNVDDEFNERTVTLEKLVVSVPAFLMTAELGPLIQTRIVEAYIEHYPEPVARLLRSKGETEIRWLQERDPVMNLPIPSPWELGTPPPSGLSAELVAIVRTKRHRVMYIEAPL